MKASLAAGCNFWNAGEFYGTESYNSLHLLNKYFTKYPEDADKVVLSIKGVLVNMHPDGRCVMKSLLKIHHCKPLNQECFNSVLNRIKLG